MSIFKASFCVCVLFSYITADEYISDLKEAKVGECYKRVYIPAKYTDKEELIEVQKSSKKFLLKEPKFKVVKKKITVIPAYTDIKDTMAKFEKKRIKLPINDKEIYYTIGKNKEIPLSDDFVAYVKKKGVDLDHLKVGECYQEYVKLAPKKIVKKEYVKKQAYEIIDVKPPKFKTVKKKIEVRPAYTKIVKTPAIYEAKILKVLVSPAKKEYVTKKDGTVCVVQKPPVYKQIVKKILKTPPLTKVIKFPPVYKEVEIKVLENPPVVTRRVVPQKKDTYNFYINGGENKYFWSKNKPDSDAKPTGLKICKRELKVNYIEKEVEMVLQPATTKEMKVAPKTVEIKTQKLIEEANATVIQIPPQYEKVHSRVLLSPAKILWKRVDCKDEKQKAVK